MGLADSDFRLEERPVRQQQLMLRAAPDGRTAEDRLSPMRLADPVSSPLPRE